MNHAPPLHTPISDTDRLAHREWLVELTQIPTAAGREFRVVAWLDRWFRERPGIEVSSDPAGNLHARLKNEPLGRPVYFTAHLDHPAFVVERVLHDRLIEASFRGGVMDDYFTGAKVRVHASDGREITGTVAGEASKTAAWKVWSIETDEPADPIRVGDIARWDLPRAEVIDGCLHTDACDDLAALAAALSAFDVLLRAHAAGTLRQPVRLLLTRAEEIGFIGAIAAVRHRTMPTEARVLALENSRSFAESPIGGGPIVRVGDRLSVFSPALTGAVAARAEELGGAASPTATQKASVKKWPWQRKLMAGGACEASVFYDAGYEATCLCLPLGNYHNMADLAAVQAGTNTTPARVAREFISLADYEGLVDLLVACGERLGEAAGVGPLADKLWAERSFVLG